MAFYIAFGAEFVEFKTFARSMLTLVSSLLTGFALVDQLFVANRVLGPLLSITYLNRPILPPL